MSQHQPRPVGRARDMLLARPAPTAEPAAERWHSRGLEQPRTIARPWESGHSLAWLAWLAGAALSVMQLGNPLYLVCIWGCAYAVWSVAAQPGPLRNAFRLLIWLGALIFASSLFFSVITASSLRGATVLGTLPSLRLPALLGGIELGGVITLEQLLLGAQRGLRLWTLLLVLGAFNSCVNHYRLLRRSPRFLFHAGLIVTMALAFIPQTVMQLAAIRDAQRLRGHRFRGWRDGLALCVPLLSGGLERAFELAQAMEARGYGNTQGLGDSQRGTGRLASGLGLALLMSGIILAIWRPWAAALWAGVGLGCLGAALIGWAWRRLGRGLTRSTYRRETWDRRATIMACGALAAPLGLWLLGRAGVNLGYAIFPKAGAPEARLIVLVPLLGLLGPLWGKTKPPPQGAGADKKH